MKPTTILLGFLFFFQTATAQDDFWELLDAPEGAEDLCDIQQLIGDTVLLSTWDSGMYISYNNGDSWEKNSDFVLAETIHITKDKKVFVAKGRGMLYYSLDTCKTWIASSNWGGSCFRPSIYVDSLDRIYVGAGGNVYRSSNMGQTWDTVFFWDDDFGTSMYPLCKHPKTGELFLGVRSYLVPMEGVWKSETGDSGTWEVFKPENNFVYSMAFDSSGNIYVGTGGAIYLTEDYGESWNYIGMGNTVSNMIILPDGGIFASGYEGSSPGVYYKSGDSTTFFKLTTGIPDPVGITQLSLINNKVFAVDAYEPNIYRSANTVANIGANEIEEKKNKFNIYPNPICKGGSITIAKLTNNKEKWDVTILNIHGRLEYQMQNIEGHLFEIQVRDLYPGIYLIKIQKGGEIYVGKLVVRL